MSNQWVTISAAIIGGFLAATAGWFISWRKDCRDYKRKANFFTTVIKDDLNVAKALYRKLIEEWKKSHTIWFDTLNAIGASREIYNKYKDWVLIYPEKLRRLINDYYHKSSTAIYYVRYLQSKKINIEAIKNQIILDLKTKNPNILDRQVNNQIANVLDSTQLSEYVWIIDTLPKNVDEFKELIQNIDEILSELGKLKKYS